MFNTGDGMLEDLGSLRAPSHSGAKLYRNAVVRKLRPSDAMSLDIWRHLETIGSSM